MDKWLDPKYFFEHVNSAPEEDLLDFLRHWHERGEEASEIKAFVDFVYSKLEPIDTGYACFDCSGTGGDRANTFNISTAAAIVAAASGAKITKHGGRSTTSKSGSVDVLEALGLNLTASREAQLTGLRENNLAFFASKVTGELISRVKQLCKQHNETCFISLLGPLTNPVKLTGQIIGVGQSRWMSTIADTLILQKRKRAMVVHSASSLSESLVSGSPMINSGNFRLDEISVVSATEIIDIKIDDEGQIERETYIFSPEDLGLKLAKLEDLQGGDAKTNAAIIQDILADDPKVKGSKINAVCLNSGALLYLAGKAENLKEGFEKSLALIESGKAQANFEAFLKNQN